MLYELFVLRTANTVGLKLEGQPSLLSLLSPSVYPCTLHKRVDYSLNFIDFSLSFLAPSSLISALKETLSVFSVSANWPAGRSVGQQASSSLQLLL